MLYQEYRLPVYPIAIFLFDYPLKVQSQQHQVNFPDLKVLEFKFASIQLNQLNWRDFLQQQNPVAAALMSKMRIKKKDRPKVKEKIMETLTSWEMKGIEKERRSIALNMLKDNFSLEQIARLTGLALSQVQQIQSEETLD